MTRMPLQAVAMALMSIVLSGFAAFPRHTVADAPLLNSPYKELSTKI
jgi:hypothetical protein